MLRVARLLGLNTTKFASVMQSRSCADEVDAHTAELDELGFRATPTWTINRRVVRGVRNVEFYRKMIEDKLVDI